MVIDLAMEDANWQGVGDLDALVRRAVAAAVAEAGLPAAPDTELSVLLTGDAAIRRLNRLYRGRDAATNVLSFPQRATGQPVPTQGAAMLGDIVLAYETVRREAEAAHVPLDHHVAHLIVHGLLHLYGYDHAEDAQAEAMEACERAVLARLGIADPYAARDLHAATHPA